MELTILPARKLFFFNGNIMGIINGRQEVSRDLLFLSVIYTFNRHEMVDLIN